MGMDPITIGLGLGAASSIYGAISGHKAQHNAQVQADNNLRAQQQAYDQAGQRYNLLQGMILPMLGGSQYNTGQDGMMQQLRGLPIDALRAQSQQDLGDQLSQLRGSVGSLGQRFGTANLQNEARLRERATTGLASIYGQLGLQQQAQENQRTLGLLSLLAGGSPMPPIPQGQFVPPQGGGYGEALGNIGNMVMLYPWLKGMGGGGGGDMTNSGFVPHTLPMPPILQGGLFQGVRY